MKILYGNICVNIIYNLSDPYARNINNSKIRLKTYYPELSGVIRETENVQLSLRYSLINVNSYGKVDWGGNLSNKLRKMFVQNLRKTIYPNYSDNRDKEFLHEFFTFHIF